MKIIAILLILVGAFFCWQAYDGLRVLYSMTFKFPEYFTNWNFTAQFVGIAFCTGMGLGQIVLAILILRRSR
jgi:hypothetical protein